MKTWQPWRAWPFWTALVTLLVGVGVAAETHGWWFVFGAVSILATACLWCMLVALQHSRDEKFHRWLEDGGL